MQHVVPNNVERCCVEMLRAFGKAFREFRREVYVFANVGYVALIFEHT